MDLGAAGLTQQPFPTHGKPLAIVSYSSEQAAIDVLRSTWEHPSGISLLQGPTLSGKSTLIRTFVESMPEDCSVAVIDGKGLNTTNLLVSVLRQFGYHLELTSATELLGLVRVFAMQQAASQKSPMLVIENAHALNPSALRTLCELAELRVRQESALKMVLVSDRSLVGMTSATAMAIIAKRLLHDFHLQPMSRDESRHYLLTKIRAAGSEMPEFVFPNEVCDELWQASGGWPGVLDRVALLALAKAKALPVSIKTVEHAALPAGTGTDEELEAAQQEAASIRLSRRT